MSDLTEGNSPSGILMLVNWHNRLLGDSKGWSNIFMGYIEPFTFLQLGKSRAGPSQDVMKRYHGTAALEWVAKHEPLVPGTIIRWRENIDNRP